MRILVLEPKKIPYVREIADDLHEMQEVVGGLIEPIYFEPRNDAIVFCNEEFLLHDFKPNRFVGQTLVHGTCFVVGNERNDDGEEVSCSLTDEQVAKYTAQFWGYLVPLSDRLDMTEDDDIDEMAEQTM